MMEFKAFFFDPIEAALIELGYIAQDTIIDTFEKIDWNDYLQKSKNAKIDEIYYHPTFEVEHNKSKNGLSISVIGEPNNYAFKITYKRPQKVKSIFEQKNSLKSIVIAGRDENNLGMLFNTEGFSRKIDIEAQVDEDEMFSSEDVYYKLISKIKTENA